MITLKNTSTRPANLLWDPFFMEKTRSRNSATASVASRINTNIVKNENGFQIQLAAPGFKKDQFNLEIMDAKLIVSLNVDKPEEKQSTEPIAATSKLLRKEYEYSAFKKSFTIPENTDLNQIKASYEHGILTVDLVKKPAFVKTVEIA